MSRVCAVVGAQFGSEGKGLIVGHVAKGYRHHVRVGAANAGHTLYTELMVSESVDASGLVHQKHVMQQLPCAAYANPDASLYIGPGALVSPEILRAELDTLWSWRQERGLDWPAIYMDPRAHVITDEQIAAEQASDLAERIGSTSTIAKEGIGAAAAARLMRDAGCVTAADFYQDDDETPFALADVPALLHNEHALSTGGILLEGTQGAGLSNTTGAFPYVTSRNTTAAGLLADVGLAPTALSRVILVARTFPIRVAGNSGPFHPDSTEMSWDQVGDVKAGGIDPESERTTVTKKVRRVATFSAAQVKEAARINGATEIALTFADYLHPDLAGRRGPADMGDLGGHERLQSLMDGVIDATGVPITYIGTGPHDLIEWLPGGTHVDGHEPQATA